MLDDSSLIMFTPARPSPPLADASQENYTEYEGQGTYDQYGYQGEDGELTEHTEQVSNLLPFAWIGLSRAFLPAGSSLL